MRSVLRSWQARWNNHSIWSCGCISKTQNHRWVEGLINDPRLDDSFRIEEGLQVGRSLLVSLAEMGIPTATEALTLCHPNTFRI